MIETKSETQGRAIPLTGFQLFWALLAGVGLCAVGWAARSAPSLAEFFADIASSSTAMIIALDLLFLGVAMVSFAVIESMRLRMRAPWIWVVLAVPLPGAFVMPLFLLLRERALVRQRLAAH